LLLKQNVVLLKQNGIKSSRIHSLFNDLAVRSLAESGKEMNENTMASDTGESKRLAEIARAVDDDQDSSSASPSVREATPFCSADVNPSCSTDVYLADSSKSLTLEANDLESSDADDYRLYARCARTEFLVLVKAIQEAVRGRISEKIGGLSLLDIGPGNGHLLKALCSEGSDTMKLSRYVAFEPDVDLYAELQDTVEKLGLVSSTKCQPFTPSTSVESADGPFDLVLLSHSLYTVEEKVLLVNRALDAVAPGGVLLIFHRWAAGGTLDQISAQLYSQAIMHHKQLFLVELDLNGLTLEERLRLSRYTRDATITNDACFSALRKIGFIGVEPYSCHVGPKAEADAAIEKMRQSVTYTARSAAPAAVVTPNTTVGIQSWLLAAAKQFVGDGSVTVVGGGHSANCLASNAIAINMCLWDHVEVDTLSARVRAGGGATIGDITKEAEKYGLVVPLGDRPSVGVGLILQGGLNHFMRGYGLAVDNLVRVVFINPSGVICVAESTDDLFCFRGAGPNFGVVLEVTLQAHKLRSIVAQDTEYIHRNSDASTVIACYSKSAISLPMTACLDAFIRWRSPDEMAFATTFFDFSDGEDAQRPIEVPDFPDLHGVAEFHSTDPVMCSPSELYDRELYMSPSFYPSLELQPQSPPPRKLRSLKRCLLFPALDEMHGAAFRDSIFSAPTKWCYMHLLHGGGAVKTIPSRRTAFGCRNWDFAAVITGRWEDGDAELEASTAKWLQSIVETMLPLSVGVYGADLGPSDWDLSPHAFGCNMLHLAEMKRRHDPLDVLRHSCPLASAAAADKQNDPRQQSRGVVVIFCGRRFAGKDWLAAIVRDTLGALLRDASGENVSVASISDSTKYAYAKETPGIEADRLIQDRAYKERHREGLTAFYERKKSQDVSFEAKCFVDLVQSEPADILLLTGVRDGLDYARRLAGRPVLFVHVTATDESKQSRGWIGPTPTIDDSNGESKADSMPTSFWDLVYENDSASNADAAVTWTKQELAPAILKCCVRHLPDTPVPGIVYKDLVGGLLLQPFGLSLCNELFIHRLQHGPGAKLPFDAVLAPEALGFLFAGPIAAFFNRPVLLARKKKPAPGASDSVTYEGSNMSNLSKLDACDVEPIANQHASLHLVAGSIVPGQRILVADDCLATGKTLDAIARLVDLQGGIIGQLMCVMELEHPDLQGRRIAEERGIDVFSIMQFSGK
jgi:phosphomevalonate kinase